MKALLDFYSTTQGSTALEDYLSLLEERKFVIDRGDLVLNPIDDLVYKCLLLSNPTPYLMVHVLKHLNDILGFAKPTPMMSKIGSANMILVVLTLLQLLAQCLAPLLYLRLQPHSKKAILGRISLPAPLTPDKGDCTSFDDLVQFPSKAARLRDHTKITVWHNNDAPYPMIERYEIVFSNPPLTTANPPSAYIIALQYPKLQRG
ncbi:uncharacterized protein N7477_006034 [Penicillium maclennaniae]|uniref:uncharacterized protein n=1 Tax=Penicillium maclennaniae TaxID=1343394 RepID=UPI0025413476|nr:uncharacterized protein N7477_006034 [Penicillium maclennaniae]KAJ5670671.1 hypothetical protein N7477_006034 [Penicillium maclennaniae]